MEIIETDYVTYFAQNILYLVLFNKRNIFSTLKFGISVLIEVQSSFEFPLIIERECVQASPQ